MRFDRHFAKQIADLAKLTISDEQADKLAAGFAESMDVVEQLTQIDTQGVTPTYQVNNLNNVWREDVIDEAHMLTQEQALANAAHVHAGYFVVPRVIDHEA